MVLFYFLQTDLCKTAMALLGRDNNEDLVCIIFVLGIIKLLENIGCYCSYSTIKVSLLKITMDGVFSVLSQCTTVNVGETPAS